MVYPQSTQFQQNLSSALLAARPKTLTASLVPIVVASFFAQTLGFSVKWDLSLYALLASLAIQIGTNFINDALDFKKGADTKERLGPTRVTQAGLLSMNQVLFAGFGFFALAGMFTLPLLWVGGVPLLVILVASVLCGYLYTGGPWPLAYVGLGDLFVLIFFGFVSTLTVFYLQTGSFNWLTGVASLQIGLLCTVLIAINNLRDYKQDAKAHKLTLAVRMGPTFSRWEITILCLAPFVLNLIWLKQGYMMAACLPWTILPLAIKLVRYIWLEEPGEKYNEFLAQAARIHLLFGLSLSLGFIC
jgi:1,4-dihydroxy-2-naphthoate octaprenyltransferase